MAAHGAGAVARSIRDGIAVMNVDVGGGTSKIAVCADGRVAAVTALDVGARLICVDTDELFGASSQPGNALAPNSGSPSSPVASSRRAIRRGLPVRWRIACSKPCGVDRLWLRVVRCCGSIRCAGVDRLVRSHSPAAFPNLSTGARPNISTIWGPPWRTQSAPASPVSVCHSSSRPSISGRR